jgi:hypothetical protein
MVALTHNEIARLVGNWKHIVSACNGAREPGFFLRVTL